MNDVTLESLAKRVEALELALARQCNGVAKDWRKVVGMFDGSEFMHAVDEECQSMREVERESARAEENPDDPR